MEKKDKNIYVIIFAIIIGLALIATIVTYAIGNKDKSLDNNNGNTDSNISKKSEDKDNKIIEDNDNIVDSNDNENAIDLSNSIIDIQKYVTLSQSDSDYRRYMIDMNSAYVDNGLSGKTILEEYNIVLQYKINNYDIKLKLADNNYQGTTIYNLYVNNNFIYEDSTFLDKSINVDVLGSYLIFRFNGGTDIRSSTIYIANENGLLLNIRELDNKNGMVPRTITINNNGIVVEGTRITHGASIVYNGHGNDGYYSLSEKNGCDHALNELPDDFLIEAVYSFKYENGSLNMSPEISEKVNLKDYIEKNNLCK